LFEQAFGKLQIIIIDPEGEFASLREKYPFVLAGKGGDTPVDLRSAGMLAHRLLKLRVSAVCDLYEMKSDQRHIWVRDFFNALIEAPKELRVPLLLGVDEFHIFAPEKGQGESEAKQASIDIATRGRKRGICLAGITQRLAMLDKNVTSQLQNRLIGPTFEEVNIKTAVRLLGIVPGKDERQFHSQIQLLEPGNFFALGRAISRERILIKVREVETAHPKAFEKHTAPVPPTPEKIKGLLPQLADLPQEAEEKARTEAEFKREIRELKQQLKAAEKAKPASVAPDPDQARTIRQQDAALTHLRAAVEEMMRIIAKVTAFGFEATKVNPKQLEDAVKKAVEEIGRSIGAASEIRRKEFEQLKRQIEQQMKKLESLIDKKVTVSVDVVRAQPPFVLGPASVPKSAPSPRVPHPSRVSKGGDSHVPSNGNQPLGELARKIAGILAGYYPEPVKRSILAAMCGLVDGGNFSARLSEVRSAGLLEDPQRGLLKATEKCAQEYLGSFEPPRSTAEVVEIWDEKLGMVARQIVAKLIEANGEPIRRADLAASIGLIDGGNFSARLSEVRSAGLLVDPSRGYVAANKEALFLEAS
jgi:hypothetical protein